MKPVPNPVTSSSAARVLAAEPEAIRALFLGSEVYDGLGQHDFREMAKFWEAPNIHGLPMHPISRPVGGELIQEFPGTLAEFMAAHPTSPLKRLRRLIERESVLAVRGTLAAGCSRPFRVTALVPQTWAHVAQGFDAVFYPPDPAPEPSDLTIIQIPDTSEDGRRAFQLTIHFPGSRLALALGTDDLRPALLVAMEAANRLYTERTRRINEAGGEKKPEEIRLLPGGSFVLRRGDSGATLVFSGESVPVNWERSLVETIPAIAQAAPAAVALAGAEPWVAEGGGFVCPLWRNAPFPAAALAEAGWSEAALDPDALPFGVEPDARGEAKLDSSEEGAFVVAPRARIPAPLASAAERTKIAEVLTHRNAREEAKELWARGFPPAKVI